MPAYANDDGKVVCFFQSAAKFKTRYATLGFSDKANLDEGRLWPTTFALQQLTAAEEAKIAALVKESGELRNSAKVSVPATPPHWSCIDIRRARWSRQLQGWSAGRLTCGAVPQLTLSSRALDLCLFSCSQLLQREVVGHRRPSSRFALS